MTKSQNAAEHNPNAPLTLVLTANGKTGRRVAERLEARGLPVRRGSRSAAIPFDWDAPETWEPALEGVRRVYLVFTPDLAVPAAPPAIRAFTQLAATVGVERIVLLSGRGEEEAQRCERIVQQSGIPWTVVRASWFNQNFDESFFHDLVMSGTVALPTGTVAEPFIDANDIADVAVAALTEVGHEGEVYEVTGPELLTFPEVIGILAEASGRPIRFEAVSRETFLADLEGAGLPPAYIELVDYLFTHVLDGRNAQLADGVRRALGREPKSFAAYARDVAATGAWDPAAHAAEA